MLIWQIVVLTAVLVVVASVAIVGCELSGKRVLLGPKNELRMAVALITSAAVLAINSVAGFI